VWEPPPQQLEQVERIEREENEARLRLEDARKEARAGEGEVPSDHHERIHKLEAEWKHAVERLHRAR
jgi:hypothetical protein